MQIGTLIAGRYRLDDRIASGGMGEVWRGTDTRLNRAVAVKLLHSGLSGNDRFRARFQQEAQAVAVLQSPGIVALYDYGEEHGPDGLVSYLIMELVRGQSLDKLLHQRGRLSPTEVLKIVATAAEALDVAHRAHIIHRDIKPGNLLIDDERAAKIVDFGIASARGQAGLTETGTVMGTLAYASPEQLSGGDLTGATDVYSLGIVAYECLAGRAPFTGDDTAAIIAGHMTRQPPPLPPDVPAPVAQIVMRCLAKEPRQRFASAAELARACRDGRPGPAPTTSFLQQSPFPPAQTTQVMNQPDLGGPPPGRDLPPPREFEEPKRSKAVPIVLTIAGVLILLVGLLIWQPWGGDQELANNPTNTDTSSAPATDEATSEEAEEEPTEETEEPQEADTSDDQPEEPDEEDTPTADEEPDIVTLGDYLGWHLADAKDDLAGKGFQNVRAEAVDPEDIEGIEQCEVTGQNPPGEAEVDHETEIVLEFAPTHAGCNQ